jgi:hypothetical protein
MLATLLPPSAGTARLWGHGVVTEPLAVRGLGGLVINRKRCVGWTFKSNCLLRSFAELKRGGLYGVDVSGLRSARVEIPTSDQVGLLRGGEASRCW